MKVMMGSTRSARHVSGDTRAMQRSTRDILRTPLVASVRGLLAALSLAATAAAQTPADAAWTVAGTQGLVRFVIVPEAQARERAAYERQIALLCEPERTCFLNFYTNSSGAPATLPLPDAIDHEPTARFRRSAKQGAQHFQWSCRVKVAPDDCF